MRQPIHFYFDFSSPYGYLASTKNDGVAGRHGRAVAWRAILPGAVFKITGGQPLPSLPLKGNYALRDIARSARFHGVAYKQPTRFPVATQAPARAFYWLNERDTVYAKKLAQ